MAGIGTITAAEVFSERVELQPRTSDPASTEEGEGWIRSDVTPKTDQIGTLRVDTGGSTVDLPIFDTAASPGADIETHLRVVVGGVQGFVPTTDGEATYPAVGVYDSGVRYGAHDSLDTIPDTEDFEDGTINDNWAGDTGLLSAQQSTVISGSWSGEFGPVGSAEDKAIRYSIQSTSLNLSNKLRFDNQTDYTMLEILSSGTRVTLLYFHNGGNDLYIREPSGDTGNLTTVSADTNYTFDFLFDFQNDQFELQKDGSSIGTFNFTNSASSFDEINYRQDHNNTSSNTVFLDDIDFF